MISRVLRVSSPLRAPFFIFTPWRKSLVSGPMKKFITILFFVFGFAGISFAEVTPVTAEKAAADLKKDLKIVVVDLRTPEEFGAGHLAKAVNVNFFSEDFEKELAKLDRTKTYVMHCKSGGRSTKSLAIWEKLGFPKVLHLDTGVLGWQKAGFKLVVPVKEEAKSKEKAGQKLVAPDPKKKK